MTAHAITLQTSKGVPAYDGTDPVMGPGGDVWMPERSESDSRKLLRRLRDVLATPAKGQERLDRITHLIADSMKTEVCSIYLFRDAETLELCATEGLRPEAVHQTRMKLGEGLVGRVARTGQPPSHWVVARAMPSSADTTALRLQMTATVFACQQ